MSSLFKQALDRRGIPFKALHGVEGIDYPYANKHYRGVRNITAEYAIRYEQILGIPRSELRPDLWPPDAEDDASSANKQEAPHACN